MKKTLITAAIAAAFAPALPVFAESYTDSAPVISVRAVTERIPVNREECWSEQRRDYEERRVTRQDNGLPIGVGTVLGAIAGGVIGHQFGSSSGGRASGFVRSCMERFNHRSDRASWTPGGLPVGHP